MAKQQDIFRTLKNYSNGFHSHNSAEANAYFDAKVSAVTERILDDTEHVAEIITDEYRKFEIDKWREIFTNGYGSIKYTAESKALENICCALADSKPLKEPKEIKTHKDLVDFMVETEEYDEESAVEEIKNYMDERIAEGMTVAEICDNIDGFINACFKSGAGLSFLVHIMNTGKLLLLLIGLLLILSLAFFAICKSLELDCGAKYFGAVKIIGGYLFYSALVTFFVQIIFSFVLSRNAVFLLFQSVLAALLVIRAAALIIAEVIRKKAEPKDCASQNDG